jgi:hypothetical protein
MAVWLCFAHFVPDLEVMASFILTVSIALFMSGMTWILYGALEPYVRKLWPQTIISWTRLISGRVRDPLVGRDALFGVMLGLGWLLIYKLRLIFAAARFGTAPEMLSTNYLLGLRRTIGAWIMLMPGGVEGTLFFFIVLIALRFLLRKPWAAGIGFVAIFTALKALPSPHPFMEMSSAILIYGIAAFAVVRFGLITLGVAIFVANMMLNVPSTFDFSRWYAANALSLPVVVLVLAVCTFYTALGGQKIIKGELLE